MNNISDLIAAKNNEIAYLEETDFPKVGIFYVCDTIIEIQALQIPLDKVKGKSENCLKSVLYFTSFNVLSSGNVYITYNCDHISFYNTVIKRMYVCYKSWSDIPKGRIIYNVTDNIFECVFDRCLNDYNLTNIVINKFNLTGQCYQINYKDCSCLNHKL